MSYPHDAPKRQARTKQRYLTYLGGVLVAVALGLLLAVASMTVLPAIAPSGYALATPIFTLAVLLVALATRRVGKLGNI